MAARNILLVGLGAVGAICMHLAINVRISWLTSFHVVINADSLILKRSGKTTITVVARSNFDAVSRTFL